MHSIRMHTTHTLLYARVSLTETPLTETPMDRYQPGQRPPPSPGWRPPRWRPPSGQRSPQMETPWTETPTGQRPQWTETPTWQRSPLDRDPWTETPPPPNRITNRCKKHYLAAASLREVTIGYCPVPPEEQILPKSMVYNPHVRCYSCERWDSCCIART